MYLFQLHVMMRLKNPSVDFHSILFNHFTSKLQALHSCSIWKCFVRLLCSRFCSMLKIMILNYKYETIIAKQFFLVHYILKRLIWSILFNLFIAQHRYFQLIKIYQNNTWTPSAIRSSSKYLCLISLIVNCPIE